MQVFQAWTEWAVYPKDFLALLKHIFLGGQLTTGSSSVADKPSSDDIDGAPLSGDDKEDEDLDGIPLDGAALLKSALARRDFAQGPVIHSPSNTGRSKVQPVASEDIDGVPLGGNDDYDDDIDGVPLDSSAGRQAGGFVPSKWETIAPDQVEAQAITTSKWDTLESSKPSSRKRSYDSSDDSGSDHEDAKNRLQRDSYDEDKRAKLREVELQTMKYQDELESGTRSLKEGMTMSSQLEQFRQKLMRKSLSELRSSSDNERYSSDRRRSTSPDE